MGLYIHSASGTMSQQLIALNINFFTSVTELEHISHILKIALKSLVLIYRELLLDCKSWLFPF